MMTLDTQYQMLDGAIEQFKAIKLAGKLTTDIAIGSMNYSLESCSLLDLHYSSKSAEEKLQLATEGLLDNIKRILKNILNAVINTFKKLFEFLFGGSGKKRKVDPAKAEEAEKTMETTLQVANQKVVTPASNPHAPATSHEPHTVLEEIYVNHHYLEGLTHLAKSTGEDLKAYFQNIRGLDIKGLAELLSHSFAADAEDACNQLVGVLSSVSRTKDVSSIGLLSDRLTSMAQVAKLNEAYKAINTYALHGNEHTNFIKLLNTPDGQGAKILFELVKMLATSPVFKDDHIRYTSIQGLEKRATNLLHDIDKVNLDEENMQVYSDAIKTVCQTLHIWTSCYVYLHVIFGDALSLLTGWVDLLCKTAVTIQEKTGSSDLSWQFDQLKQSINNMYF